MTGFADINAKIDYELGHLAASDRDAIDANRETIRRLGSGSHLQDYLGLAPGLMIQRSAAMRVSNSNRPVGRRYNDAFEEMLRRVGVDTADKKLMREITAIMWIAYDRENQRALDEVLLRMTPAQVMRINLPTSARAVVAKEYKKRQAEHNERAGVTTEPEPNRRAAANATLKAQLDQSIHEIADLQEQLAAAERHDGESRYNLISDNAGDIASTIVAILVEQDKRAKAMKIAKAMLELLDHRGNRSRSR